MIAERKLRICDIKSEIRTRNLLSTKPVCYLPCYDFYAKETDSKERKGNKYLLRSYSTWISRRKAYYKIL